MVEVNPSSTPIRIRYWRLLLPVLIVLASIAWYFGRTVPLPSLGDFMAGIDPGGRGDVAFTLVWTHANSQRPNGPDIDLWVKAPNGVYINSSGVGVGLGPASDSSMIDIDDQGGEMRSPHRERRYSGQGGGPERAFWPEGRAPRGEYAFGVRYYSGTGVATYTVRVYNKENVVATHVGFLKEKGREIPVGTFTY